MTSKRRHEGYLLIDNRFGPGVSEAFIRATGKDAPIVGEGQLYESATKTCAHCQVVVILRPERTRPRGYCRKCDAYVCDGVACNFECVPVDQVIDHVQEAAFRKNAGYSPQARLITPILGSPLLLNPKEIKHG